MPEIQGLSMPLVNSSRPVQQKIGPVVGDTFSIDGLSETERKSVQTDSNVVTDASISEESLTPALLLSMLKNSGVTATYLENLSLLLELIKTMPQENENLTKDMNAAFEKLFLLPQDLAGELETQNDAATLFKGKLFDFLRDVSENYHEEPATQTAIALLLRSVYGKENTTTVLKSATESLIFLKDSLPSDNELSKKLSSLIEEYKSDNAKENFPALRQQTITVLKEISDSNPLPKIAETISALKYNLSRFGVESENLLENALKLYSRLNDKEKQQFIELFAEFTCKEQGKEATPASDSKVMTALTELLSKEVTPEKSAADAEKLTNIVRNLLITPSSYMPLLHSLIPLQIGNTRAMAELWTNPDGNGKKLSKGNSKSSVHVLMTIDVEDTGRFEAEFSLNNNVLDFTLFCPQGTDEDYKQLMREMPKLLKGTPYSPGRMQTAELLRTRSLSEVFGTIPKRRLTVDVKA